MSTIKSRILTTPTGTKLNCKGWVQEGALRMLHNNLDPDVAERPEEQATARTCQPFQHLAKMSERSSEDQWESSTQETLHIVFVFRLSMVTVVNLCIIPHGRLANLSELQ